VFAWAPIEGAGLTSFARPLGPRVRAPGGEPLRDAPQRLRIRYATGARRVHGDKETLMAKGQEKPKKTNKPKLTPKEKKEKKKDKKEKPAGSK
jgi:hypothetical protein